MRKGEKEWVERSYGKRKKIMEEKERKGKRGK